MAIRVVRAYRKISYEVFTLAEMVTHDLREEEDAKIYHLVLKLRRNRNGRRSVRGWTWLSTSWKSAWFSNSSGVPSSPSGRSVDSWCIVDRRKPAEYCSFSFSEDMMSLKETKERHCEANDKTTR
ncbi:hypothetical protein QLX08_005500 [Tetragonisca angustula]|uniref:Uncharacterized protein n=1 Tax=Tetragonisca angustula TaxID=166442 RepID=A0AAW0ZY20_9HYME